MSSIKIDVTKDLAMSTFESLTNREKNMVIGLLHKTRIDYLSSSFSVDVPYYFLSLNRFMFDGIDYTEYLEIDNSMDFAVQTIFYISRYLINKRKEGEMNDNI
jgi:hypothetical protein